MCFGVMKKLKIFVYTALLAMLLLVGCSRTEQEAASEKTAEVPYYERNTSQFQLAEDANLYMMDYAGEGFFYFVMGEKEEEIAYTFYYQPYDGKEAVSFCEVTDGYVRDFSGTTEGDKAGLSVLRIGDEACILRYDEAGKLCKEMVIDSVFNTMDEFPGLLALPDGGYVIGMADEIYVLDAEGQIKSTFKLNGEVNELYAAGGEIFATVWSDIGKSTAQYLARLDVSKKREEEVRKLPDDIMGLFAFEDGFVSIEPDKLVFFRDGKEDGEILADLNKQSLLAGQIQFVFGNRSEIKVLSADRSSQGQEMYLFALREKEASEERKGETEAERELYAPDGRRIVRVAIPQEYEYQLEFHAKKYNQTSDTAFVQVERFEGSLEDFLGKGNRPDVIMFHDQTEIDDFVQKGILEDLLPLFEGQEKYSLDGIIPKARELLGIDDAEGMYAMAAKFELLLHLSDGTEFDSKGRCDTAQYLKWYDSFLTENEVDGAGNMESLLYAALPSFYDEATAETFFTSDGFRELMETYREVYNRHEGELDPYLYREKGQKVRGLSGVARWHKIYMDFSMVETNLQMEGLPCPDGESHVYMKLADPMGIMSTSECKDLAFDFIMYYSYLEEFLWNDEPESQYGNGSFTTDASFSVHQEILDEEIFKTEQPYAAAADYDADGKRDMNTLRMVYYTDEQLEQLRYLLDSAEATTKAQEEIYTIFMEEIEPYLQGAKALGQVCEILQSRIGIYLEERK